MRGAIKLIAKKSLICHVAQFYFKFLIFIFVDNATSSCGQFLIMWTMISITCHNSNVRIVVHHLAESCDSLFSQTFFCILNSNWITPWKFIQIAKFLYFLLYRHLSIVLRRLFLKLLCHNLRYGPECLNQRSKTRSPGGNIYNQLKNVNICYFIPNSCAFVLQCYETLTNVNIFNYLFTFYSK